VRVVEDLASGRHLASRWRDALIEKAGFTALPFPVTPMQEPSRRRLESFIARVDRLRSYSFFDGGENIAGATVREKDGRLEVEFHGPPDEATDAVLLHIRVLMQGDDVSFMRLAELYADPGLSDYWKEQHAWWRAELNRRLDEAYAYGPQGSLMHRDLFHMILYGGRGHEKAKDPAYRLYREWVKEDWQRQSAENTFFQVVIWIYSIAHNIAVATREELAIRRG
jgi:hypothetical protein